MQEVTIMPWWLTVFLAIWAALGPFAGVLIGAYLTRRSQREQWVADNKRQEFKSLLRAMTRLNSQVVKLGRMPSEEDETGDAESVVMVAETSLFISDFLRKSKVIGQLLEALKALAYDGDVKAFVVQYHKNADIIRAAAKETL